MKRALVGAALIHSLASLAQPTAANGQPRLVPLPGVPLEPQPRIGLLPMPVEIRPHIGVLNLNFERRGLDGWTKTGTAFDAQPTYQENVRGSRVNPIVVGGDYWRDISYPIGVRGNFWIGTYEARPNAQTAAGTTQGDGPTGTLTSISFKIPAETAFITFLIGGGNSASTLKLELLAVIGTKYTKVRGAAAKTGLNNETFRRDWWSVAALDKTVDYAIRITDNSSSGWGHINVDDIRFEATDPRKTKLADGTPTLLQTAINGKTVWVDYDARLWGAADLHTHPMSHLSMGGKLMHGAPDIGSLAPRGTLKQGAGCNQQEVRTTTVEQTLPDCSATHGGWGTDNSCGDTIRAAVINFAYDTNNVHKLPVPHEASCDPGMLMDAGLCYRPCNAGYHGNLHICHKDCPPGFGDTPYHCSKPAPYGRGVGYVMPPDIYTKASEARSGYSFDPFKAIQSGRLRCEKDFPGGCDQELPDIWYPKCKPGWKAASLLVCWQNCRPGYSDVGAICSRDGIVAAREKCERDNPQGCDQDGAIIYPKCNAGYHAFGCCVCSPDCPAGMTDIGVSCQKNDDYERGFGTMPLSNAHGDHMHAGYPTMAYWPHASSKAHQQMYADWIKRAHEGGLNVLVALAVNNELLGEVMNGDAPKDDRTAGDKQIDEIRSFIGRHSDFMKEVKTAAEYRKAVKDGKLAVIVGVEIDNIGNFNIGNPLLVADPNAVTREIQRLFKKGVRYVFPLHFADNVFGGVAVKGGLFNLSNRFARTRPLPIGLPYPPGLLYKVMTATDPAINYRLSLFGSKDGEWASGLTLTSAEGLLAAISLTPYPPAFNVFTCPVPRLGCVTQFALLTSVLAPDSQWDQYAFVPGGHANVRGLTPVGEVAIREMMRLGMFIDIDHMSDLAANRTLEIAEGFNYPVNSGHTGFRQKPESTCPLPPGGKREPNVINENMRTPLQLRRLGQLGGMMGVGWAGGDACHFLESYRFGIDRGTEICTTVPPISCTTAPGPAFSLGSDINGFEQLPSKRAGSDVRYCKGDACSSAAPPALRLYEFGTTANGTPREWEYNNEGVAHIGLYPDIYQDLKNLQMSEREREAFFGAADAVARMWDKIEVQKRVVK